MPGLPPRPPYGVVGAAPPAAATPLAQRTEGARRASQPRMNEELLVELQFACVAEALRRVCFAYGNRFVEVREDDSDGENPDKGAAEQRTLMHQLPDTDAGPHDAARVSPSVLFAFAEDMMITPHLLLREETTQAVVDTLDRRRRRAHLPASMDKTLYDFLVVCAIKVMAKRPYCNVYGGATTRQKVRALVDFLCIDCEGIMGRALDSRFSPINEIEAVQTAVHTETQRSKEKKRKYKTLDVARTNVSQLWTHVHEIFLFFCETPLPPLPDAVSDQHKEPKSPGPSQEQMSVVSSEDGVGIVMDHAKSKIEVTVEIKKVNLEAITQFHPAVKKANEFFAARRIQRCFRRKYKHLLDQRRIVRDPSPIELAKSLRAANPRPPCGPAVASLLPRIDVLTSRYTLSPHPAPMTRTPPDSFEQAREGIAENLNLPLVSVSGSMITRPLHELIKWKRMEVEADSVPSSPSSASVLGTTEIPIYNDRLGRWAKHTAMLKKAAKLNPKRPCSASVVSSSFLRPGTTRTRPQVSSHAPPCEDDVAVSAQPRVVGAGDRRTIVHEPTRPTSASTRPPSAYNKGSLSGRRHPRPCTASKVSPKGSVTSRDVGQGHGGEAHTKPMTSLGGTKIKNPSVFSDDAAERKAALEYMARRNKKSIPTMRITPAVEQLHEQVLEKWLESAKRHDPFTYNFNQAALKIQRMGRAWLTRKIVREGKFLRDGMQAWLSARQQTHFSSAQATAQLSDVVKIFKIFGVCPKVVDPPEVLRECLQVLRASHSDGLNGTQPRSSLTWSEFQDVCWRLSFKMSEELKDDAEPLPELDALIQIDELLRLILEGKTESFDPKRATQWIRDRIFEFAEQKQLHESGGPKGMSPLRAHSKFERAGSGQRQKAGSFKRGSQRESSARSERRLELARSVISEGETQPKGARSSVGESVGLGVGAHPSADGVSAYLNMCAQLDEEPVPTILRHLHGTVLDLSHYHLSNEQVEAVSAGLEKNTSVVAVTMMDCHLTPGCATILCETLLNNTGIRKVDLSENDIIDKHSLSAISHYIAKTHSLQSLTLRGIGLSDVDFDFLVRHGFDFNHKSLTYLDLAYNMLSDDSITNLKQMVYGHANMQTLDLSWNMLSAAGIKQIDLAVYERAKPRSSKRPSAHKNIGTKPMPKLTVNATAKEQRIALMHFTGASGAPKWAPDAPTLISQADFVTLCIAQRSPKLARIPLLKMRLLRLLTSGRGLSAKMVAQQLAANFKGEDPELQAVAFDVLVRTLFSPSDAFILKDLVDEEFVHLAEEHVSGLSGSPSTSPSNKKH